MNDAPQLDPQKIRMGYAVIGVMILAAVVLAIVIDNNSGRAVFALVALFGVYRLAKLQRSLRTPPPPA